MSFQGLYIICQTSSQRSADGFNAHRREKSFYRCGSVSGRMSLIESKSLELTVSDAHWNNNAIIY